MGKNKSLILETVILFICTIVYKHSQFNITGIKLLIKIEIPSIFSAQFYTPGFIEMYKNNNNNILYLFPIYRFLFLFIYFYIAIHLQAVTVRALNFKVIIIICTVYNLTVVFLAFSKAR